MSELTNSVTIQYGPTPNDLYSFPVESEIMAVDIVPVWDSSERTVIATRHSYTIRAFITNKNSDPAYESTNSYMETVRRKLTQPCGTFIMSGAGFRTVAVNSGGDRDVMWGPKPRLLQCKHLGGERAWEITWRVEVAILDQCAAGNDREAVMEFCYGVTYNHDVSGLTVRHYTGHLRIPQTRQFGSRKLEDNADAYRELVQIPVPRGFRRKNPGTFSLSQDKCKLDFTIIDEQLPGPAPPPGIVDASGSHIARSSGKHATAQWECTLTGEYEVALGQPKELAWHAFRSLVYDRLRETKKRQPKSTIVPLTLSVSEPEIYGKRHCSFRFSYTNTIAEGDLFKNKCVFALSMWRRPPGSDWQAWAKSMVDTSVWSAEGSAKLRFNNGDDLVVDLCLDRKPRSLSDEAVFLPARVGVVDEWDLRRVLPAPTPANSWIDFGMDMRVIERDDNVHHKVLPGQDSDMQFRVNSPGVNDVGGYLPSASKAPGHVVQNRAAPTIYLVVKGRAVRWDYPITPPRITKYNGVDVTPMSNGPTFETGYKMAADGRPIVAARWRQVYLLHSPPTRPVVPVPFPLMGDVKPSPTLSGFTSLGR